MNRRFMMMLAYVCLEAITLQGTAYAVKPQPPVTVILSPEQAGQGAPVPGTPYSLLLSVRTNSNADSVKIQVKAGGGARIVDGEQDWFGSLKGGEEQRFPLKVLFPQGDKGFVDARVVLTGDKSAAFVTSVRYPAREENAAETRRKPAPGADGKGRGIVEYDAK